jgi:hypothetical protein
MREKVRQPLAPQDALGPFHAVAFPAELNRVAGQ